MTFKIRNGRIYHADSVFLAIGVNYHPARAACAIWTDWDPAAIAADFDQMRAAGVNTVRMFAFWRDFQPAPGLIDKTALARLRHAVQLAAERDLACVVSLFTIWMNGERLDLPWRGRRGLWRDTTMLAAQEVYARAVARTLADARNLLAIDLGDEISNAEPAEAADLSPAEVTGWYERMANVIRGELPGVLICQANGAADVLGATSFGPDAAMPLDLVAVHGFPTWSPGAVESTLSYKATNLVAFLVRFAAAYGTPFVDEIGSYGVDEQTAARFLRTAAASAIANGTAGVLPWCWIDVMSAGEPYGDRPMERFAGLHRADGCRKPVMAEYQRIIDAAQALSVDRIPPATAIYLPERIRERRTSYLDGHAGAVPTFISYLLLKRQHVDVDLVAGQADGYALVVCPSVGHLTLRDQCHLRSAAERGATVYFSLGNHLHAFPGEEFSGSVIVDYALDPAGKSTVTWGPDEWKLDWTNTAALPTVMRATRGRVAATYEDGTAAVVVNRIGAGTVIFSNAPFEDQVSAAGRLAAGALDGLYGRVTAIAGVEPTVTCADPEVEVIPGRDAVVLVNHGESAKVVRLSHRDGRRPPPVTLDAKDWAIVPLMAS